MKKKMITIGLFAILILAFSTIAYAANGYFEFEVSLAGKDYSTNIQKTDDDRFAVVNQLEREGDPDVGYRVRKENFGSAVTPFTAPSNTAAVRRFNVYYYDNSGVNGNYYCLAAQVNTSSSELGYSYVAGRWAP